MSSGRRSWADRWIPSTPATCWSASTTRWRRRSRLGGGTVEKFIGDAVVAVFGAPAAQEDHAERALQVALWMQERLAELFGDRLALRIGVNTGEVVVGRPREGSSFATGDAVNVAARL